ncbi:hypothetical protein QBC33DRAFT_564414 [Phialemonium atrogriseum]|uniref:PITH domain-containing protein n=1 Tax=Phialemonium atrogriseum TaxID=1093897 RepID=A0AAJ0FI71_9PEZI|nr:uncharacterized protein QBC33DRAFT_564414 [Phialemonium atrogriseum]KAK1761820.1 hypothetical protein QBC33DRAFT_564414 [Phialemonium atrogriseum]
MPLEIIERLDPLTTLTPRSVLLQPSYVHYASLIQPLADRLRTTARKTAHLYMVYGATEHIYKACAAQADYKITWKRTQQVAQKERALSQKTAARLLALFLPDNFGDGDEDETRIGYLGFKGKWLQLGRPRRHS